MTSITVRFDGFLLPALVTVKDGNQVTVFGPTLVAAGGQFTFTSGSTTSPFAGGQVTITGDLIDAIFGNQPLTPVLLITSCGSPPFVGSTYNNFTVLAGESLGGPICCDVDDLENDPPDFINFPDDIDLTLASGECTKVVNWDPPTASDNCGAPVITADSEFQPGDSFGPGDHVITYRATDEYGNTVEDELRIRIRDETDPVISGCPGNITVNASSVIGTCGVEVTWAEPSVEDCSATSVTRSHAPGLTSSRSCCTPPTPSVRRRGRSASRTCSTPAGAACPRHRSRARSGSRTRRRRRR